MGPGQKEAALAKLLTLQPHAVPNLIVVEHADRILGLNGELLKTVRDWDAGIAWSGYRRRVNKAAIRNSHDGAGRDLATRGPNLEGVECNARGMQERAEFKPYEDPCAELADLHSRAMSKLGAECFWAMTPSELVARMEVVANRLRLYGDMDASWLATRIGEILHQLSDQRSLEDGVPQPGR